SGDSAWRDAGSGVTGGVPANENRRARRDGDDYRKQRSNANAGAGPVPRPAPAATGQGLWSGLAENRGG
ncbi:hypothetical protein HGT72_16570, partial [Rosenbergiella nectarea subsp. apis]|nr:hypothetical protein [Rosenbergiella nectarea subsp. apis]